MILVGICDADASARSLLVSYIERYQQEHAVWIQTISFDSPAALLKNYLLEIDLLFLEVPFGKKDAILLRALYRDRAGITIQDEPTAALDPLAEAKLYGDFASITGDKTTLLISPWGSHSL